LDYLTHFLEYLKLEKKYSKHTVIAYQKDIKCFYEFLNKTYQITSFSKVEPVYVRRWIGVLKEEGIVNSSINRKITALKTFYNYLLKLELVSNTPLLAIKSLKTAKKVLTPFNEREIEEVLQFVDNSLTDFEQKRNRLIVHLLYATGIRRAELIDLKLKDVDLSNKTIKVLGKRNKERVIPLYEDLIVDLRKYLPLRSAVNTVDDVLFVTLKGEKLYPTLVYRLINAYFSKVTTKQKKSPHVLRHSYATDLVNNGADLNSVKELLGHSGLAATQVYTHNSLDQLKQVYNKAHPRGTKKK